MLLFVIKDKTFILISALKLTHTVSIIWFYGGKKNNYMWYDEVFIDIFELRIIN